MNREVAVLMTTFNGEEYVVEQIKSIQRQTYTDWRLYIRDDGSSDDTVLLINEIAMSDPRIIFVSDTFGNIGVKAGYLLLLSVVEAKYYFFSDQDDVWLPQKLKRMLTEFTNGINSVPMLVHTNLTTVDKNLNVLNKQFYPDTGLDDLNIILSSNSVTGCTAAINESLKEKMIDDTADMMVMHDWWFALCAVTFGKIQYIKEPMILYRQHDDNQVGTDTTVFKKLHRIIDVKPETDRLKASFAQAKMLLEKHGAEMMPDTRQIVSDYCNLPNVKLFQQINDALQQKFRKRSFLGTISFWRIVMFHL